MTRKLVTIQRIKELVAIDGADRIELALVLGWQVVVQKGHKAGDLVLFFEIDSFLPAEDPRYASFSERFHNWGDKRGMRVKTIKLRKQLSQGVIMPLTEFPESLYCAEGEDMTEILKIEKWEPIEKPLPGRNPGSSAEKRFPAFIPKTDQERIQNYGALVGKALDEEFEVTMKKDGSSVTVFKVCHNSPYYKDAKTFRNRKALGFFEKIGAWIKEFFNPDTEPVYGICSRNLMLPLKGESNFLQAVANNDLFKRLDMFNTSVALQGEVVAPDIQENHEKVIDVEFHLFDIFDIDSQKYFLPLVRQAAADAFGINHCTVLVEQAPLTEILKMKEGDDVVKVALTYAIGPGDNPGVIREGVVFKSTTRDFSFKAVSNEYLLKTGK